MGMAIHDTIEINFELFFFSQQKFSHFFQALDEDPLTPLTSFINAPVAPRAKTKQKTK